MPTLYPDSARPCPARRGSFGSTSNVNENNRSLRKTLKQTPLAATIASILAVSSAQAATIVVNTTADPGDGSSCSLRSAVQAANTNSVVDGCDAGSGADEIVFDASLAYSTITLDAGEIEITGPLTITGRVSDDPDGLTIDAAAASRIFNIKGNRPNDFEVGLNSLTLTKGQTVGSYEYGGAIRADQADLHLDHVVVRNSSTGGFAARGGGVSVGNGNIDMVDSSISGNSTTGQTAYGGGLSVRDGNAVLTNSTVSNNSTDRDFSSGGGLSVWDGNATLTDSTVSNNSTNGDFVYGGGLSVRDGNAVLTNSLISGNSTTGIYSSGGGLYVRGNVDLTSSLVSGNATSGTNAMGGGIFHSSGVGRFADSTLSGNSTTGVAAKGGGMYTWAPVEFTGSTINDNSTMGDGAAGGGLHVRGSAYGVVIAELTNSTVSGNSTNNANGGGLYAHSGDLMLVHVTVAANTASDGTDGIHLGPLDLLILNNSLIVQSGADESACNVAASSHSNSLATDSSCGIPAAWPGDIALGPLTNNGGPAFTHALSADSVAINAAGNCGDDFGIITDQRGEPRPGQGSTACDIGAFEFQILPDAIFADRFRQP